MIKLTSILCMLAFLVGCSSTFPSFSSGTGTPSDAEQFRIALENLEHEDNPAAMKKLAKTDPQSVWSESANSILRIHSAQQNKINLLSKKNKELLEENKRLSENLNKLNRINLDMEKRSP